MHPQLLTYSIELAEAIINSLVNETYYNADGSIFHQHIGHGSMWNSSDCDADTYTTDKGDIVTELRSWIYPCEGHYNCPLLDAHATDMSDYIKGDDDEDEDEENYNWDDVLAGFVVKTTMADNDLLTVEVSIDHDFVTREGRQVFHGTFDNYRHHHFDDDLTASILEMVDKAITNFDGSNTTHICWA